MDYIAIHKKWQKRWEENGTNKYDPLSTKPKYYAIEMFPYPSAYNLHMGHFFNFAPADTHARFKRMCGYNVFHPMGFDAFGLPSENYAIKNNTHPYGDTKKNVQGFIKQLDDLGIMTDWTYSMTTSDPEYYKWTQWLFLQLYKHRLAYQKDAPVNWCDGCKTVLANEQSQDGTCERCSNEVIKRNQKQWFFKITEFAEELLNDLENLDWPEKTKAMQKHWIGKSDGAIIKWQIIDIQPQDIVVTSHIQPQTIETFTTRADTIHGATFLVLAPEHPLVPHITKPENKNIVESYIMATAKKSDIERMDDHSKTGVFTGSHAINPVTQKHVPIYIADYVLYNYGTGAIMGVPGDDQRDHEFATKYDIQIIKDYPMATLEQLCKDGYANQKITYRLRDWSIGRQRYWGAPIPIIYCDKCGIVPVPENDLPVKLPYLVDFKPHGAPPLENDPEFVKCICPKCSQPARRETETMDTFVCSSWYFLRYPSVKNDKVAFDTKITNKMLPIDTYTGGSEHACGHLLQARFITKFLQKFGYINFCEPAKRLIHQGLILASNGQKMAKSNPETMVLPEIYTKIYGSDVVRLYLLFGFNYLDGGPWNDATLKTTTRFVEKIEKLVQQALSAKSKTKLINQYTTDTDLEHTRAKTIKAVYEDLQNFSFNTAVARCMEYVNALSHASKSTDINPHAILDLVLLVAPMMPHIAEELYHSLLTDNTISGVLGCTYNTKSSIFDHPFPTPNKEFLTKNQIEIAVQINSKIVGRITIPSNATQADIEKLCEKFINGKVTKKVIYITGRLINFII